MTKLIHGDLELKGPVPWASNYTLLADVVVEGEQVPVIYKPSAGAAPLWDFDPQTLALREVAAYLVSEAAGWGFVPATVFRDGPHGLGAVQMYVEHDPAITAFDLGPEHEAALKSIAVFDIVINNADRKAGHVLLGEDGRLWAIDHGICFHEDPKLRTVLWEFISEPIPKPDIARVEGLLRALSSDLRKPLSDLLSPAELTALEERARALLRSGVFPEPGPGRPVPWPQV